MKKIYLVVIILFSTILQLSAQDIYISEDIRVRKDHVYEMVGMVGEKYVLAESDRGFMKLYLFDQKLDQINTIEEKIDERRVDIKNLYTSGDSLHVFYSFKSRDTFFIGLRSYEDKLQAYTTDTVGFMTSVFFSPQVIIEQSEDESKYVIVLRNANTIRRTMAYDIHTHETTIDVDHMISTGSYSDELRKILITDKGRIIIVTETNNTAGRVDKHTVEIYLFDPGQTEGKHFTLPATEYLTFDSKFFYDNRMGTLAVGGLYNEQRYQGAKGVFYLTLDLKNISGDQLDFKFVKFPFTDLFLKNYHNKLQVKRNSALDVTFQQVVLKQDGGVILFFEEQSIYRRYANTTTSGYVYDRYAGITTDFHLEDLYIYNFSPEGELIWEQVVPKNQYSSNDSGAFSSFFLFENPNHFRVIYNDEVKRNNSVSETVFLSNGYSRRNTIMNVPLKDMQIQVNNGIQTRDNEIIFPALSKGNLKIIKMVVN